MWTGSLEIGREFVRLGRNLSPFSSEITRFFPRLALQLMSWVVPSSRPCRLLSVIAKIAEGEARDSSSSDAMIRMISDADEVQSSREFGHRWTEIKELS